MTKKKKNQDKKFTPHDDTNNTPDATKKLIVEQSRDDSIISHLPKDVLSCIISFLPFRSAVKTSFLSSRWKDLWKMTLVRQGTIEDAVIAISGFIIDFDELHRSRGNWGLQFNFGKGGVLLAAVSPNNKLHLDFSTGKQEFPRQFGWLLELNLQDLTYQPSPSTFFVKSLYLVSVSCNTSEAVYSMVSNFPFLESLTLAKCNGLRSLHINGGGKLVKLTILDCLQLKSLNVRSPQLESFRYRGQFPWFWPEHYFYLVDAMLDFRRGLGYHSINKHDFQTILFSIKRVRSLTLCRWIFEGIICPKVPSIIGDFHFYNLRELWWIDYSKEGYNSNALISFLKLCPYLERLFVTNDPKSYNLASTNMREVTRKTKLELLEVVKLDGFTNPEDEILLAQQLKEVFNVEPRIIATSHGNFLRRLVITEQEGKRSYKFVEEAKHTIQLSRKHAHMGV